MRIGIKAFVAIFACASAFSQAGVANAQDTSAPIFSTPATRSPSTVPVLEDKTNRGSPEIIQSVGGGNRPAETKPQAGAAETSKDAADGQTGSARQSGELVTKKFGSWVQECLLQIKSGPPCQIIQRVVSTDGKQIILVLSMARMPEDDTYRFQIAVPLGISVPHGIEVRIGSAYTTKIDVARCTPQGCLGEGKAEEPMIKAMRAGAKARVVVRGADQKQRFIDFSLNGFTKAVEAEYPDSRKQAE